MKRRAPSFWYDEMGRHGPLARALAPAAYLYTLGGRLRADLSHPAPIPVPVICIGNLVVGGGGKTPAAIAIADLLTQAQLCAHPFFLSRGYGGFLKQAILRDDGPAYTARDVGDEPLLLAPHAPVVIDAKRGRGAMAAVRLGADVIVMDDGMQNPGIRKDLVIAMVDGATGFGNGQVLPAGPLREPLPTGLARADVFIVVGEDQSGVRARLPADKPVFSASLIPAPGYELDTRREYVAFTGIAHPGKFRDTLERLGAAIVGWYEFPDHHPFTGAEFSRLLSEAERLGARVITTEKDYVRIREFPGAASVEKLPVLLKVDRDRSLVDILAQLFKKRL